ncbi:uncharacterized protein ACR2FA_010842 [Aphomia sociella]
MFRPSEVYISSRERREREVINQTDVIQYDCEMCDDSGWSTETELELHRRYVHSIELCNLLNDKTRIVCVTCAREQPDRQTLYKHIKEEHLLSSATARQVEREIYVCDYCHHIFFNKNLLVTHIQQRHILRHDRARIQCPKCFKLLHYNVMYGHFEMHRLQSISLCPICLKKCKNKNDLSLHVKMHKRYYHCDICQYNAKNETRFLMHIQNHKYKRNEFKGDCMQYFVPQKGVIKKKFQVHYMIKGLALWNNVHICVLCRKICMNQRKMRIHMMEHTDAKLSVKKKHLCLCGEEFFNNVLLKQHIFKLQGHHRALSGEEEVPQVSQEVYIIAE